MGLKYMNNQSDCQSLKIGVNVTPSMRQIECLTDIDAINNMISDWWALLDADTNTQKAFLSPDWVLPWLGRSRACFVCVWENDTLVALMPMMMGRELFGAARVLHLAASDSAAYGFPFLARSNHARYFALMLQYLRDQQIADIIQFDRLRADTLGLADRFTHHTSEAVVGSILDLDEDLKNIGVRRSIYSRTKKEGRQKRNKLEKNAELKVECHNGDVEHAIQLIGMGLAWKKQRLRLQGRLGLQFSSVQYRNKLVTFCRQNLSQGECAKLFSLSLDGKPVALSLHWCGEQTLYNHFSSFDPEMGYFSPGTILFGEVLDWMIEQNYKIYDFMGYPEAYKQRFSNREIELVDFVLPLTAKGRAVGELMRLPIKSSIKHAFYALPLPSRQFIAGIA